MTSVQNFIDFLGELSAWIEHYGFGRLDTYLADPDEMGTDPPGCLATLAVFDDSDLYDVFNDSHYRHLGRALDEICARHHVVIVRECDVIFRVYPERRHA